MRDMLSLMMVMGFGIMGSVVFVADAQAQACDAKITPKCQALNKLYVDNSSSLPNFQNQQQDWLTAVKRHFKTQQTLESDPLTPKCAECGLIQDSWQYWGKNKTKQIAETWADYVKTLSEDGLQFETLINSFTKSKDFGRAAEFVQAEITQIEEARELNKMEGLRADFTAVEKREAALKKRVGPLLEQHRRQLASVKCPAGKVKNAALQKTYRARVEEFYSKPAEGEPPRKVYSVELQGKSSSRYDRWNKTTFETTPLTACVEIQDPRASRCYVWSLSIQRKKLDGQAWQPWDTVLVGERNQMLCEKLK